MKTQDRTRGRHAALLVALLLVGCHGEKKSPEPFDAWTLEELTPDRGFSLRSDVFEVESGTEVQDCYFIQVPDLSGGQDLWMDRFQLAQNPGSHHLNIFRVKTLTVDESGRHRLAPDVGEDVDFGGLPAKVVRGGTSPTTECWKSANWADWPLVANTQKSNEDDPYTDWKLPAGVAARFTPGEWLMVQTHYVNATTQKTPYRGRIGLNFYRYAGTQAPIELGTLFATKQSIRICRSNPEVRFTGTCSLGDTPTPVTITAVNGHFHSRGRRFEVFTWDGTSTEIPAGQDPFYVSTSYDDPPMTRDLAIEAPRRGGILWSCEYAWKEPQIGCDAVDARDSSPNKDCCFTFGPIVETSEHCNVFVYYYPKLTTDISCR